jgi:hypothetical protein
VRLKEGAIVLRAYERARVAGKSHHRQRAENGVDGAALEAEFAQVGSRKKRARRLEERGGSGCTRFIHTPI